MLTRSCVRAARADGRKDSGLTACLQVRSVPSKSPQRLAWPCKHLQQIGLKLHRCRTSPVTAACAGCSCSLVPGSSSHAKAQAATLTQSASWHLASAGALLRFCGSEQLCQLSSRQHSLHLPLGVPAPRVIKPDEASPSAPSTASSCPFNRIARCRQCAEPSHLTSEAHALPSLSLQARSPACMHQLWHCAGSLRALHRPRSRA